MDVLLQAVAKCSLVVALKNEELSHNLSSF